MRWCIQNTKLLNIGESIIDLNGEQVRNYLVSRLEKKCSDFDETDTSRLEMVKCGANLVSDQKVVFSQQNQCAQAPDF